MRPATILLIVYCLVAAIGLGLWAWHAISETRRLSGHMAEAEAEMAGLEAISDTKLTALRELEAMQREGRKSFSGPEAVDASYAVQVAQSEFNAAEAAVDEANREMGALERAVDAQSRLVVPMLAGVLLHLLFGISVWRSAPRSKHAR